MDKRTVALCAFGIGIVVIGLVSITVYQNYRADRAEEAVERAVFWMGKALEAGFSENAGVKTKSVVGY